MVALNERNGRTSTVLVAVIHSQSAACATSAVLLRPCTTADSPMQAVKTLASHTDWIAAIAWHPQSAHHLATASHDSTVKLWDTRAAVPLHTIAGHTDKVVKTRVSRSICFAIGLCNDAHQSWQLLNGCVKGEIPSRPGLDAVRVAHDEGADVPRLLQMVLVLGLDRCWQWRGRGHSRWPAAGRMASCDCTMCSCLPASTAGLGSVEQYCTRVEQQCKAKDVKPVSRDTSMSATTPAAATATAYDTPIQYKP
jgi:WD domain, G-beta repeat